MNIGERTPTDETARRNRRLRKKRNDAFKQRVEQDKSARREQVRLKWAISAAAMSWLFATVRLWN